MSAKIVLFLMLTLTLAGAADLQRGQTFTDGQRITAAQLHALVDAGSVQGGFYTAKPAQTNVALSDLVLVWSPALGSYRKVSGSDFLLRNVDLIVGQSEKTVPIGGDFLLMFDSAGTVLSKLSISNVFRGSFFSAPTNWSGNYQWNVYDGTNCWLQSWTNLQTYLSTNWFSVLSMTNAMNTNLTTTYSNAVDADVFWIYDSTGASNKTFSMLSLKRAVTNSAVIASSRNLVLQTVDGQTNKVSITADEIILKNTTNGAPYLAESVSLTIDMLTSTTNGLDTGTQRTNLWYYVYVISDGTNVAGLFSTNQPSPVLPTNYQYKAFIGAVWHNQTNTFNPMYQLDREAFIWPTNLLRSNALTSAYTMLNNSSLSNMIPPVAKYVKGTAGSPNTALNAYVALAGDTNGVGEVALVLANLMVDLFPTNGASMVTGFGCSAPFKVPLVTPQNFAVKSIDTLVRNKIVITGYGL